MQGYESMRLGSLLDNMAAISAMSLITQIYAALVLSKILSADAATKPEYSSPFSRG